MLVRVLRMGTRNGGTIFFAGDDNQVFSLDRARSDVPGLVIERSVKRQCCEVSCQKAMPPAARASAPNLYSLRMKTFIRLHGRSAGQRPGLALLIMNGLTGRLVNEKPGGA